MSSHRSTHSLAFILAVAVAAAGPASAQDERENTFPTDWTVRLNATAQEIQQKRSEGYRIVTLDTVLTGIPTFVATFVRNRGEYYRAGETWYYGSASFISSKLSGKRITELEPYVYGGNLYFAAAMISNTGAQAKSWAWYYGTQSFIASKIDSNRIVDLDTYQINGTDYYSAVMIANTGADRRDWWWYTRSTEGFIITKAISLKAQIRDVERVGYGSSDKYCALLTRHPSEPTPSYGWFTGKSWTTVNTLIDQHRHRPVKIESLASNIYSLLILDNRGTRKLFGTWCGGTRSGTGPTHTVTGTAARGGTLSFNLSTAKPNRMAILMLGTSKTRWGGTTLPFRMDSLGAPGCSLYLDPVVMLSTVTSSAGSVQILAKVPGGDFLGVTAFSQFFGSDPSANAMGAFTSNAYETVIGQ